MSALVIIAVVEIAVSNRRRQNRREASMHFQNSKKGKSDLAATTQIELFFQKYLTVILQCTYKTFIQYVLNGI